MWLLRSEEGKEFFLLPGQSYLVGRKDGDLVLEGDASISRRHASLSVSRNSRNKGCVVTLRDFKSKYGTFKRKDVDEWDRILPEHDEIVGNGEVIKFGIISNIWIVKKCVVTPSGLTTAQKKTLATTLANVGTEFTADWMEQCSHLTMNTVTLTVKAVCALALGVPIVTPDYWRQFDQAATQNLSTSLAKDFIPPFGERTLDASRFSLDVHKGRRQLFAGMRFVFANEEQLRKKGCLVTSAGGAAVAYDAHTFSFRQLCEPQTVLVNFFSNESQELLAEFSAAIAYSEGHGRRKIPEAEIGLAILDCSIERHCNPLYRPVSSLLLTVSLETQTQSLAPNTQVLALETQNLHHQEDRRNLPKNIVIPDSGSCSKGKIKKETQDETLDILPVQPESTDSENRSRKRQGDSLIEEPHFKKPASVCLASTSLFTKEISTERAFSILDDSQDSKESLNLDLDAGQGYNENEDDPFNFSKCTRSRPSRKRAGTLQEDDDLFGSLASVTEDIQIKEEIPKPLEVDEDEDMFAADETDNVLINSNLSLTNSQEPVDSLTKRKSRKVLKIDEAKIFEASTSNNKFVQKSQSLRGQGQLNEITSKDDKPYVSLKGFLSVMKVKKREPVDIDDLQDAIECLVVVEKKPLIARREPPVFAETSSSNSALINFKRFRKIMHVPSHETIVIDRSSAFNVSNKNNSTSSEEEDRPAESQQCFEFVSKKRKR